MRSDNPRRRALCVVLLALSGALLFQGLAHGALHWGWLLLAGMLALPGFSLVPGWVNPVLHELVLEPESLRWGPVDGSQVQVARRAVASMYFGDDAGAADLLTGDRKQLPMEIIGARMQALARATARLWPGTKILTRFESDVSSSLP